MVLQQVMSDYAGALRTEALLDTGYFHLQRIKEKAHPWLTVGELCGDTCSEAAPIDLKTLWSLDAIVRNPWLPCTGVVQV